MQNKFCFFSVIALCVIFFSCKNDKPIAQPEAPEVDVLDTLGFGMVSFTEISKSCATDSIQCAKVEMKYPLARGGKTPAYKIINLILQKQVAAQVGLYGVENADSIKITPQEAAKNFINTYDTAVEKGDIMGEYGWTSETDGSIIYKGEELVTMEVNTYANTGGAHPNYYSLLLNFDANTGELLDPKTYIDDTAKFKEIAQAAFYKEREMEPNTPWKESGFYSEEFILPNEMGFMKDSLLLTYNTYEIGAYVLGMTSFKLAKKDLEGIMEW